MLHRRHAQKSFLNHETVQKKWLENLPRFMTKTVSLFAHKALPTAGSGVPPYRPTLHYAQESVMEFAAM